jgi:RHS repeat-associated protein
VSNETQGSKVWFDDVKVTHTYSRVTQASDYYAFGSVMREQKSPDDLVYRYGYQGEYSEKDLETGWNHFEAREYDPIIGRWLIPDPAREFWSPYLSMGNDAINSTDPDGRDRIHKNSETGQTFVEQKGFWSFDWLFGDRTIYHTQAEWDRAGRFTYGYVDNGFPGHSFIADEDSGTAWEAQHPTVNGEIVNGGKNWINGGAKSQVYEWKNWRTNKDFWSKFNRGEGVKLANVWVPDKQAAINFVKPMIDKTFDYNFLIHNCSTFSLEVLKAGGRMDIYNTMTQAWGSKTGTGRKTNLPFQFVNGYNASIPSPR